MRGRTEGEREVCDNFEERNEGLFYHEEDKNLQVGTINIIYDANRRHLT